MRIQAEVSVYPLKEQHLSEPIALLRSTLARYRLATKTGTMIAEVAGDSKDVFRGLRDAFERLAEQHDIVLVCKVSNCCAVSASGGREDEILNEIRRMLGGEINTAGPEASRALSAESRDLIALAAAIAHQREAKIIEICVEQSLASGATPESVMQVVSQATQMAELPAESYVRAARRGIEVFRASNALLKTLSGTPDDHQIVRECSR